MSGRGARDREVPRRTREARDEPHRVRSGIHDGIRRPPPSSVRRFSRVSSLILSSPPMYLPVNDLTLFSISLDFMSAEPTKNPSAPRALSSSISFLERDAALRDHGVFFPADIQALPFSFPRPATSSRSRARPPGCPGSCCLSR